MKYLITIKCMFKKDFKLNPKQRLSHETSLQKVTI